MVAYGGWIFANLMVPYLFPFVIIRGIQTWKLDLKPEQHERLRLTYLLKDAQLSVGSVAIAAAAAHELLAEPEILRSPWGIVLVVALVVLVVANSILFVCGTVIGSPLPALAVSSRPPWREWRNAYPMAANSMVLALGVSAAALAAHYLVEDHRHDVAASAVASQQRGEMHAP